MPGVYELYIKTHFSAAHRLKDYPGDCAKIHGHNWIVEVFVKCRELNDIGIGIDFKDIKVAVKNVIGNLDHVNLSDLPIFESDNPSSENIAKYLYQELSKELNSPTVSISKIKVSETPGAGAFYWEE